MDKSEKLDCIVEVMGNIASNKYLTAIKNGMALTIPITIIGSFFLIILNLPIPGWSDIIAPYAKGLTIPYYFSMGMMAVYACIGIASDLCDYYDLDKMSTSSLALMTFLILTSTPESVPTTLELGFSGTVLPMAQLGAQGLFTAIISAILTVETVRFFYKRNLFIKMPDSVPKSVINSFASLIPGIFLITLAFIVKVVIGFDINEFLQWLFSPIGAFAGNNLLSVIVPILIICSVWLFGIHGMIIVNPILNPFWYSNLDANMAAASSGQPIPYFMTEQFFQWFVWIGGAGATLALAILLTFNSKSKFCKTMGKATIIPGIFNINEPIIFGLPIIMNPYFAIPFILAPLAMGISTYFFMGVLHLVSYPVILVPWTLPGPIGAIMTTMDWRAGVLCTFNICLAIIIYYPFFKIFDKKMLLEEKNHNVE